jgi:endonuclease/exonuclease/phosphatase family metal-dependent hydrolase
MRVAVVLTLLAACDLGSDAIPVDAAPIGDDAPLPPNGDLVPPVGSDTTLDIACWNIENFPKDPRAPGLLVDLITSLELDIVVVEEIASTAAWDEVLARLPQHDGVLSTHRYTPTEYQKIGVIYRRDLVTAGEPELLFPGMTYAFPRPPFKVHLDIAGVTPLGIDVIGVHLKAGTAPDDSDRRAAAMRSLDQYVRAQVDAGGEDEVIIAGDFNETIDTSWGMPIMAPMLASPDRYTFRDYDAAFGGQASFIPSGRVIDHIVTTAGLEAEIGATNAVIPRLDTQMSRYEDTVSDHLPVVLSIPAPQ